MKGRGPGEIIDFRRAHLDKERKTLSFFQRTRITKYDIDFLLKDSLHHYREITVTDVRDQGGFSGNARLLDEDRILWVGMSQEKRFAVSSAQNYVVYDDYPAISENRNLDCAISIYGETMTFSPKLNRFAKGTYIGGVLEIFQIDRTQIIPRKISYIYEPLPEKVKGSKKDVTWGDNTIIGFEAMDCTDNYIYALLNGTTGDKLKNPDLSNPPFTDHISVFDWDANPVRSVNIGKNLCRSG